MLAKLDSVASRRGWGRSGLDDCGVLSNRASGVRSSAGGVLSCSRGSAGEALKAVAPHVAIFPAAAAIALELVGVAATAAATTTTSLAFALAAGLALRAVATIAGDVTGMFSLDAASTFACYRAAVTDEVAGAIAIAESAFRSAEIRVVLPEA